MHVFLIWFSAVSFFVFGSACFVSDYMKREFARYELAKQRALIGTLQLAGGFGLLVGLGLGLPWIGQLAAGGIALLMLLGVGIRIKIRDSLIQTVPAFFYMLLNAFIALVAY